MALFRVVQKGVGAWSLSVARGESLGGVRKKKSRGTKQLIIPEASIADVRARSTEYVVRVVTGKLRPAPGSL